MDIQLREEKTQKGVVILLNIGEEKDCRVGKKKDLIHFVEEEEELK